jgi:hypothetical protein
LSERIYTEAEGRAAIKVATQISSTAKEIAIVRLFAIAQVFYRQPVGEEACQAMRLFLDDASIAAMFFIAGASRGGGNCEHWARIAQIGNHPPPVTSRESL